MEIIFRQSFIFFSIGLYKFPRTMDNHKLFTFAQGTRCVAIHYKHYSLYIDY